MRFIGRRRSIFSPPSGIASRYARIGPVSVCPGSTALTRIPAPRTPARPAWSGPSTPCLAAVYCGWPGAATTPGARRHVHDRAAAALRRASAAARAACRRTRRSGSTSIVRCQSAYECSTNGFGSGAMPAMLHAQSSPPNVRPRTRPSPPPTRRRRRRRRSATAAAPISAAVARAASSSTSATTTCDAARREQPRGRLPDPAPAAGDERDRHAPAPATRRYGPDRTTRPFSTCGITRARARPRRRPSPRPARTTPAADPSPRSRPRSRPRARARARSPRCRVPRSSVANEIVRRSSAALLGAYVDERACCGLSS